MEWLVFALVVVAVGVGVWWFGRRRAGSPNLEDVSGPVELDGPVAPPDPHPFDREWLLNRSKEFDPAGWDDSGAPRAPAAPAAPSASSGPDAEAPQTFDRAFLEQRERERREGQ